MLLHRRDPGDLALEFLLAALTLRAGSANQVVGKCLLGSAVSRYGGRIADGGLRGLSRQCDARLFGGLQQFIVLRARATAEFVVVGVHGPEGHRGSLFRWIPFNRAGRG